MALQQSHRETDLSGSSANRRDNVTGTTGRRRSPTPVNFTDSVTFTAC
jgi:hypothetical protein